MTGMSTDPLPDNTPASRKLPGRLIAFRADRLGARLVSLMNAMRIAQDYNAGFACAWTDSAGVGHVFNDPTELFETDFVRAKFLDADEWRAHRKSCETLTGQLQQSPDGMVKVLATGQDLVVGNAFGVITLKGENPDLVTTRFRSQFQRITFAEPLAKAMRAVADALQGFTAYHIRRGDLTGDLKAMNKPWPHKMVPNEFYEHHIQNTLDAGGAGVVLFSDDPDTVAHYSARFPSLRTMTDLIDLTPLTEAQRDLLELFAMSRCEKIIAPQRSAFSSTAADLSGAQKMDVTEALSDADRTQAHQALYERLRDRTDSFAGPGEIGQCLAHIGPWLEEQERWDDARNLFAARVADGLNISFVYPRTMGYQHRTDDTAGVIETAAQMRARSIVHVKDQAAAEILHGYAHLRRGDRATGLRHIVNGFWHAPTIPSARSVVPFLIDNAWLDATNFLPSSPLQRGLFLKRGPLKAMFLEFPELLTMEGVTIPRASGSLEPVLWDWAPLMRSISVSAEVRRGTVARFVALIESLPDDPETAAERASMLALYDAFGGDPEPAIDTLQTLADQLPADAMIHQRLSHAHRIARNYGPASKAAWRAVELAPDWPAMRAWAGLCLIRTRDYDEAVAHLQVAADANVGLPSAHALLAEGLQHLKQPQKALASIETALSLAPLEVDYTLRIARILYRSNRVEEAIAQLQPVVAAERAPAKLYIFLIEMLESIGQTANASEMAAEARRRSPDHPVIAELADRLAA